MFFYFYNRDTRSLESRSEFRKNYFEPPMLPRAWDAVTRFYGSLRCSDSTVGDIGTYSTVVNKLFQNFLRPLSNSQLNQITDSTLPKILKEDNSKLENVKIGWYVTNIIQS